MERGFTLIELIVTVAIVGVLASIAIPEFNNFRSRAYDTRLKSDLRNVATALHAYRADHFDWAENISDLSSFSPSEGVYLEIYTDDGDLIVAGSHPKGSNCFCLYMGESLDRARGPNIKKGIRGRPSALDPLCGIDAPESVCE